MDEKKDKGLQGNEKIEEAILALQQEPTEGSGSVMSTFLTDMEQLFRMTLTADDIEGVILNPWNRTLMLDKRFLHIILGE